jgi:hypothetical protein
LVGAKCGSIFIDMAFKKWLRDLIGEDKYQVLDRTPPTYKIYSHESEGEQMRKLMKTFLYQKQKFRNGIARDISMDLPEPYQNLNLEHKVIDGEITITELVTAN